MQPNRVGRVLGVTARVAAAKLKEAAAAQPTAGGQASSGTRPRPAGMPRVQAAGYAEGGRRLARGAGRFGTSLVRPFAHATGVLTLEISGVFFALFTLFFVSHAWQIYKTSGWHDRHFAVYAGLGLLFAWFAVTSFWRARRKTRGR